jgi:hypothetical protein
MINNYIYINNNINNIKNIINSDNFINHTCKKHNPVITYNNDIKIINLNMLIKNIKHFPHEITSLFNISNFKLEIIQKKTDNRISFSLKNFNINNDIITNIFKNFNYKFIIFINENPNNKNKSILTINHKFSNLENNDIIIGLIKNYIENILTNILTNKLEEKLNFFLNQHI